MVGGILLSKAKRSKNKRDATVFPRSCTAGGLCCDARCVVLEVGAAQCGGCTPPLLSAFSCFKQQSKRWAGAAGSSAVQGLVTWGRGEQRRLGLQHCFLHREQEAKPRMQVLLVKGVQGKHWGCWLACNTDPGLTSQESPSNSP